MAFLRLCTQIKPHPTGKALEKYIREFGERNRHLANGRPGMGYNRTELRAAWFVSHCATQSRREKFAKAMRRVLMSVAKIIFEV